MKNLLLISVFFLFLASSAFPKKVDVETAKRVGINFYFERVSQHHVASYPQLSVSEVFPEKYEGTNVYYILNIRQGGFVIVASDDVVTPVLGYSFEGSYSEENHPPQFDSWMKNYAKNILSCISKQVSAGREIVSDWERLKTEDPSNLNKSVLPDVAPLEISTWDQGANYNALCPVDPAGPDGKVWAGCVATAMSQVMFYYRWPDHGMDSHCYTPWGYPEQCADFGNTYYNWNGMLNSISFRDTAVAELIWHAGVSVDMMYSPSGSGAYSEDAVTALINNFRYGAGAHLVARDDYPLNGDEYPAILRDNLNHKRPMYYDGYGTGGHAFNVDGYQGTNYFHFNWGWSGSFNGYFYLNNLNPGGDDFTNGQRAMVDIYPDTLNNTYPRYCSGQTLLTSLSGTFEDGSGPRNYQNNANASWLIAPESIQDSVTSIILSFSRFSTEPGTDVVKVYKGMTTNDSLVGTYSGNTLPPSLTIPGNRVLVTFNTNGTVTDEGWFASYSSQTMTWCRGTVHLTEQQGDLNDGSLDFNYKNNTNCHWMIEPDGGGAICLTFHSFNTEPSNDFVRITDLETMQVLAQYSGSYTDSNLPGPVTAPSGKMFILFVSNNAVTDKGWSASYYTYPVGTDESKFLPGTQVFPNPATDKVNLRFYLPKAQHMTVELTTPDGRSLRTASYELIQGPESRILEVSDLPRGMYILRLTGENETLTKKIVLE